MVFRNALKKRIFGLWMTSIYTRAITKPLLMYHLVFPLKYKKSIITEELGKTLVNICEEISERYEIEFMEIGHETNHVHFLIQSVPKMSVNQMVRTIKSIIAREIFRLHTEMNHYGLKVHSFGLVT